MLQILGDKVLIELSVWNGVQMVCIQSSWCQCCHIISKFRMVNMPFWQCPFPVFVGKRPFSGCCRCFIWKEFYVWGL